MKIEELKSVVEKGCPGVALKAVRESLLVENPADLPKVATFLKDGELKLDYLSSVTPSDFVDFLETVYHFYSIEKKTGPYTLRVRVKKDNPVIPSLTPIYRGAEYQERDAFDLFGIEYEGHPDPRRIMMWDSFEGFPMRKDYKQENSEVLEDEDIAWLEKHNVTIPEDVRKKAEEAKNPPATDEGEGKTS